MNDSLEERIQSSWSYAANAEYLYSIYLSYREGLPIETTWEEFFHKNPELTHDEIKAIPSKFRLQSSLSTAQPLAERLLQIEKIFIKDGHRYAQTNPLENLHENPIIQQIKNELRDD